MQARASEIEAQANCRFADEVDAAQERGEIQKPGGDRKSEAIKIPNENFDQPASFEQAGIDAKDLHNARQVRDAEKSDPGIVARTNAEQIAGAGT